MNFLGAIITGARIFSRRIVSKRTVLFEEIVIWTVPSKKCMKPPYANQKCFDYTILGKWECEFENDKKTDPRIQEFLKTLEVNPVSA